MDEAVAPVPGQTDPATAQTERVVGQASLLDLDEATREALTSAADRSVYPATQTPKLSATNGSHRSGECLHFVVQKHTSSGWRTVTTSPCRTTNAGGRARWTSTAVRHPGMRYRVRAEFAGDDLDLAAHSLWVAFRFQQA